MNKTDHQEELDFVLHHYREGAFDPESALRKLKARQEGQHKRWRWVAVAASVLFLVAFAAVFTWKSSISGISGTSVTEAATGDSLQVAIAFHFDDTPLPQVLNELGQTYGVHLEASDSSRHLTGDFCGESLDSIVGMIEDVLGVSITTSIP